MVGKNYRKRHFDYCKWREHRAEWRRLEGDGFCFYTGRMSTPLLYLSGLGILGGSLSYLAFSAFQFMKEPVVTGTSENKAKTRFMGQAMLAFGGFLLGGQLVQMHQENVKLAHQEQRATQQLQQMAAAKKEVLNQGKSWARRPEHRTPRGRFVERETGVKAR